MVERDHVLVSRLLDLGSGSASEIVAATVELGMPRTLRELWTALLPRLGDIDGDVAVRHELSLPGHHAEHGIRLRPADRTAEVDITADAPVLSLSQDSAGFVDLFRAVFGGRQELGVAAFGEADGDVAKRLTASFADRPCLGELAHRHGSCKWGAHWGPSYYERYLAPLRDERIRILEIGIGGHHVAEGGESLRMWRDYFPRADVYGLDLYDKSGVGEQRIQVLQGDQADEGFLADVVARTGPLDVVIDDGSHVNSDVLAAFRFLFPNLVDGGLYFIEDLQSSYWPAFGGSVTDRDSPRTTSGFLKTLVDGLQHQEFLADHDPSYLDRNVAGLYVHHLFAVVEKGPNTDPSSKANWMRYLDLAAPMAALEIGPRP